MILKEFSYPVTPSLMEGYLLYLMRSSKMKNYRTRMIINMVRKFHNYVGKPHVDVTPDDIRGYLTFLEQYGHLKNESLSRHLTAAKKTLMEIFLMWNVG